MRCAGGLRLELMFAALPLRSTHAHVILWASTWATLALMETTFTAPVEVRLPPFAPALLVVMVEGVFFTAPFEMWPRPFAPALPAAMVEGVFFTAPVELRLPPFAPALPVVRVEGVFFTAPVEARLRPLAPALWAVMAEGMFFTAPVEARLRPLAPALWAVMVEGMFFTAPVEVRPPRLTPALLAVVMEAATFKSRLGSEALSWLPVRSTTMEAAIRILSSGPCVWPTRGSFWTLAIVGAHVLPVVSSPGLSARCFWRVPGRRRCLGRIRSWRLWGFRCRRCLRFFDFPCGAGRRGGVLSTNRGRA